MSEDSFRDASASSRKLVVAGMALGVGMGGFVDGIALHQLLQLHNMMSARYPVRDVPADVLVVNLEVNMFWDGLFHVLTWMMTAIGLWLLWQAVKDQRTELRGSTLLAAMLLGWGMFNLVEGIINHHLLHLHHVVERPDHLFWDLIFLASGVLMVAMGWFGLKRGRPRSARVIS